MLKDIPNSVLDAFNECVKSQAHDIGEKSAKIVYTALHGTGNVPVRRVLDELGYDVTIVKEQEKPNGDFPTVASPNPENAEALELSGKIKTVCIDKTGTLTVGAPTLADTVCFTTGKTELLAICSALERPNEHPLA
jgi:hypothetical protein